MHLRRKGEYALALESYEKSINLNQNYIDAISNMGIVYDAMEDFTKAEKYFNKALLLDPNQHITSL